MTHTYKNTTSNKIYEELIKEGDKYLKGETKTYFKAISDSSENTDLITRPFKLWVIKT